MQLIVRQISGLGNQLFQYAAGLYYSKLYGAEMEVAVDPPQKALSHGYPRPFLLSKFSISASCRPLNGFDRLMLAQRRGLRPVTRFLKQMSRGQVIAETLADRYRFHQNLALANGVRRIYLVGYWQAHRYAEEVEGQLRSEFAFREPPQGNNLAVMRQIQQTKNSVSLHVRRGDYTLAVEGNIALPMAYYRKAIDFFKDRFGDPTFFVFSDDLGFAQENLPRDAQLVFVDHNDSFSAHEDLRLMSCCRGHIIANSTFSWWAAWLDPHPDKNVFSPKYWHLKSDSYFPDLLPPSWTLAEHRDERLI